MDGKGMEKKGTTGKENLDAFLNSLLLLYEKQFSDKSLINYKNIIMNILIHIYKQCNNNKHIDAIINNIDIIQLSDSDNDKVVEICKNIKTENKTNDMITNIVNFIYKNRDYYVSKPLTRYFTDRELIKFSLDIAKPRIENTLILCSGTGGYVHNIINNYKHDINMIDCYDNNEIIRLCSILNNYVSTNNIISSYNTDIIYDNFIKKEYDLILCDFPLGVRNIINANCNDMIKQLKIRGTKVEPLILQLIMTSLKKNGRACIIVPNTLLYNDSKQHVETRSYLLNNYDVKKIVSVSLEYQHLHDYMTSIIYFENTGRTYKTQMSRIEKINDTLTESEIDYVSFEQISNNDYNLSHMQYIETHKSNITTSYDQLKLKDIGKFVSDTDIIDNVNRLNGHYITIPHIISNNNNNIKIIQRQYKLEKNHYSFCLNDEMNHSQNTAEDTSVIYKYINIYILKIVEPLLKLCTTGKLNKLDINKLYNIPVYIPCYNLQMAIIRHYDMNCRLESENLVQIYMYKELQKNVIDIFTYKSENVVKLKDICSIDDKPNGVNTIMIQRNSKTAGNVSLSNENTNESTNIYFLNNVKNINNKCLYYLLKNKENELAMISRMTITVNIPKNKLEDFELNIFDENIQKIVYSEINELQEMIDKLVNSNKSLSSKNILKDL
jgi:hypothetical protein